MLRSLSRFHTIALAIMIFTAPATSPAASDDADTLRAERDRSDASLNIKIDESGIRIQGEMQRDSVGTGGRIQFDAYDRDRYRDLGRDIVKFGEDVHLEPEDMVRGDIVVFGGDVIIEGRVMGNVVVMAGDAEILSGAEINGDVVVLGGVLEEDANVTIHGERVMFKEISIDVAGWPHLFGAKSGLIELLFVFMMFFISVILSFLIILFVRDRVDRAQEQVANGFLKSVGTGFLVVCIGSVFVVILAIILLITLIGIPLSIILVLCWAGAFLFARTVAVYALGLQINERINLQTDNPFAIVLVGTAVLYLPALIGHAVAIWPFGDALGAVFKVVGVLASTFAYLVGMGALFLSRFGSRGATTHPAAAAVPPPSPSQG